MNFERGSGVLLHPTSFPGPYGIGDLGREAYRFVDFLQQTGQKLWQILPLAPTGYGDSPYDALLDEFEPDAKTADVANVLAKLRAELVPLVQAIMESGRRAPVEILQREYPAAAQEAFAKAAVAACGFEFTPMPVTVSTTPLGQRIFNSSIFVAEPNPKWTRMSLLES